MFTKPSASGLRERRTRCDEECLRRIAARPCRLDESSESDGTDTANATRCCSAESKKPAEDDCSSPKTIAKSCCNSKKIFAADTCAGHSTKAATDDCCNLNGKPSRDCCRPDAAVKSCCDIGKAAKATICAAVDSMSSAQAIKDDGCRRPEKPIDNFCRSDTAAESCCAGEEPISAYSVMGGNKSIACPLGTKQTSNGDHCSSNPQDRHYCSNNNSDTKAKAKDTTIKSVANSIGSCEDRCCRNKPVRADVSSRDRATTAAVKSSCEGGCCEGTNYILQPADKYVGNYCAASTKKAPYNEGLCDNESNATSPIDTNGQCVDNCCNSLCDDTGAAPYACSRHLQDAFYRFEAVIQMGLRLCRKIQDQLSFCCCSVTPDGLILTSRACSTPTSSAGKAAVPAMIKDSAIHTQCFEDIASIMRPVNSTNAPLKKNEADIENAAAREHIVVRVSGMTCTGCSKRVMNVLTNISGVSDANVIFVSEIAEWDLDKTYSVDDMLRRVEQETGFTLNRAVAGYQHLHVYMSNGSATALEDHPPNGLVSIFPG